MKKNWRFFAAFALGAMLSFFGKSFWETMLIIALVAVIIESIIYLMQKKRLTEKILSMKIMYNFNTNDYLLRIPIFIIFFGSGF